MTKDTSTSFSSRFNVNGHSNILGSTNTGNNSNCNSSNNNQHFGSNSPNSINNILPNKEWSCSPDLEALGNRPRKSRAPSPLLSSDQKLAFPLLKRRLTKRPCVLISVVTIGVLFPIWIFTSGAITLDSFNDVVRYLPGYHYFANNLLYLVMFLLLVSFTLLATLPILPIFALGLPFHFLIFSIFNRLMEAWLRWCIGCYMVLFLAPVGSMLVARIKTLVSQLTLQHGGRREHVIRHKHSFSNSSSSSTSSSQCSSPAPLLKYQPLHPNNGSSNINGAHYSSAFERHASFHDFCTGAVAILTAIGTRIEYIICLFSITNRTSTRWRLMLALVLWFSYVIPVLVRNEPRDFDPAGSAPSFNILHPEHLCSARDMIMTGLEPRHETFDGYWQEYMQFHQQMVLPEEDGGVPFAKKKFLIFQPSDDGLGNRLQALLSTVVMAMVTKRAIILDWVATPQCNANFTDLFQQPEGLSWDLNTTIPHYKDLSEYQLRPEIWYPYCRNCAIRSPITPDSPWSPLLCDKDLGISEHTPIAQIISTHWFLPVIQHNAHWRQELCQMFPDGGKNVFQLLAKKLLKPSALVQTKIDSVMERIPEGSTLVGLQVRRTENNAVGQDIEDAFLSCAAEAVEEEEEKAAAEILQMRRGLQGIGSANNNIQGDNRSLEEQQPQEQRTHGRTSVLPRVTRPKFAYYLATDYRPTRAHFQEVLGGQLYVLENTFQSYKKDDASSANTKGLISSDRSRLSTNTGKNTDDSSSSLSNAQQLSSSSSSSAPQTEAVVRNSVQGVQTAVAEMFILAQCDRIVSSPYSTFGYFAHGYANVQPNIVKRDGTCTKRQSTQPCFQYWFGFANGGAKCQVHSTIEMSEDYDCWL